MKQQAVFERASTVALNHLHIQDSFWSYYIDLVRNVVLPYQWEALNDRIEDAEPSGAVRNFKIAAHLEEGEFYGMVFQDSDVAKWLEAAANLIQTGADPELERIADEMIDIIAMAQHEDGYLNTYFTIQAPTQRWSNLAECHELYCAGHMIEAGVAYFKATGKRKLLDVVCKLADCIDSAFGLEPGKLQGYDGHQEVELALVKLYQVTGEERYLRLSSYFLNQRGQKPSFFEQQYRELGGIKHFPELDMALDLEYSQSHLPVRQQEKAVGHAVRLVYMLTGMADVAAETKDQQMLDACIRLWTNIVTRQMYITGGIGSMAQGEAFSFDYDLPNDTVYAETCASVGLIFFAHRMLQIEPDSQFADVMERALYNTVVAGMSRDGKHFFYVNPLEVDPAACGGVNKKYNHVKPVRQEWFGCACCPPNIARLLSSLGSYIYTISDDTVYTHLYIGGQAELQVNGQKVRLSQSSDYPWSGHVVLEIEPERVGSFTIALRIPDWCKNWEISINGTSWTPENMTLKKGYIRITRQWAPGDTVELNLEMAILRQRSHPFVRANAGKIAIQRGPLVYCLEQADNGPRLHELLLPADTTLTEHRLEEGPLGSIVTIEAEGQRMNDDRWSGELYAPDEQIEWREAKLTFIPYYAWANRGEGEMTVWVRE